MYIVHTITNILEAMVQDDQCGLKSWQYEDKPTANVRLDNKKPSPTALFIQISDWTLGYNTITVKESANVNISFLDKEAKLDAGGLEQDQIIDNTKDIAIEFLARLKAVPGLIVKNDPIKMKSVFLRSDSNRTGVNIELEIEQRQGECIGGPVPSELTITENGEYNVLGIAKITVNIE